MDDWQVAVETFDVAGQEALENLWWWYFFCYMLRHESLGEIFRNRCVYVVIDGKGRHRSGLFLPEKREIARRVNGWHRLGIRKIHLSVELEYFIHVICFRQGIFGLFNRSKVRCLRSFQLGPVRDIEKSEIWGKLECSIW